jgi:2-dehydropantoate 2-reductase
MAFEMARAGHAVTLIGRPLHVDAIKADGLMLDTQSFKERVQLEASVDVASVSSADVVLFCVKSTDTGATAAEIAPYLLPSAVVLSLQNGVENAALLSASLPQQVIPAVVYVATEMAGPGHVKHNGRGELVIGQAADSARIAAIMQASGIPVQVSDNVMGALWAKLIVNCAYNALSAITQMLYGRLVQSDGVEALMEEAVRECLAVAHAGGIVVPGDSLENVRRIAQTMADQYSSTAQDVARGKPTEIDYLNGYVCRQGKLLAVATPVNHALTTLVKLIAQH